MKQPMRHALLRVAPRYLETLRTAEAKVAVHGSQIRGSRPQTGSSIPHRKLSSLKSPCQMPHGKPNLVPSCAKAQPGSVPVRHVLTKTTCCFSGLAQKKAGRRKSNLFRDPSKKKTPPCPSFVPFNPQKKDANAWSLFRFPSTLPQKGGGPQAMTHHGPLQAPGDPWPWWPDAGASSSASTSGAQKGTSLNGSVDF